MATDPPPRGWRGAAAGQAIRGLSSGLIPLRTLEFTPPQAASSAQVADVPDLPGTPARRLGKRVGGNPSGVRISYPPPL
jgi:hypothetical protein